MLTSAGARPCQGELMDLRVDPAALAPPFEQLRRQIRDGALDGSLPAGQRLPTVRALAAQLGLAVNTVARAYRELEVEGVIATHGRAGTTIAWSPDAGRRELEQTARAYAARSRELALPASQALELVRAALDDQL